MPNFDRRLNLSSVRLLRLTHHFDPFIPTGFNINLFPSSLNLAYGKVILTQAQLGELHKVASCLLKVGDYLRHQQQPVYFNYLPSFLPSSSEQRPSRTPEATFETDLVE